MSKSVVCVLKLDPTTRTIKVRICTSVCIPLTTPKQSIPRGNLDLECLIITNHRRPTGQTGEKFANLREKKFQLAVMPLALLHLGVQFCQDKVAVLINNSVPTQLSNQIRQDFYCSPASKAHCVELPPDTDSEIPAVMAESSEPGKAADVTHLLSVPAQLDSMGQACDSG